MEARFTLQLPKEEFEFFRVIAEKADTTVAAVLKELIHEYVTGEIVSLKEAM